MALSHATVATSTTARLVLTLPVGGGRVMVYFQNTDATNDIYVGGKNVSTTGANQGLKIAKGSLQELTLDGGDAIWAVSSAGTPNLTLLWTRN